MIFVVFLSFLVVSDGVSISRAKVQAMRSSEASKRKLITKKGVPNYIYSAKTVVSTKTPLATLGEPGGKRYSDAGMLSESEGTSGFSGSNFAARNKFYGEADKSDKRKALAWGQIGKIKSDGEKDKHVFQTIRTADKDAGNWKTTLNGNLGVKDAGLVEDHDAYVYADGSSDKFTSGGGLTGGGSGTIDLTSQTNASDWIHRRGRIAEKFNTRALKGNADAEKNFARGEGTIATRYANDVGKAKAIANLPNSKTWGWQNTEATNNIGLVDYGPANGEADDTSVTTGASANNWAHGLDGAARNAYQNKDLFDAKGRQMATVVAEQQLDDGKVLERLQSPMSSADWIKLTYMPKACPAFVWAGTDGCKIIVNCGDGKTISALSESAGADRSDCSFTNGVEGSLRCGILEQNFAGSGCVA